MAHVNQLAGGRLYEQAPPKHCSWMNQIEVWFGILSAKVIRRGSFSSLADLETKIRSFIDYFARTMAKPFKWKFKGFPVET